MRSKHAAEIRKGVMLARSCQARPGVLVILNSRHFSKLASAAFNAYRRRRVAADKY